MPAATPRAAPTLLVAAHPDDEVIGAGAQLGRLKDLVVVHVTDGAPRNLRDATAAGFPDRVSYAKAREREFQTALALLGSPCGTAQLGIVDQEASLDLAGLAERMMRLIDALQPRLILTHPYEGGHPDHDATAFAVHVACAQLQREKTRAIELAEMTSYHNDGGRLVAGEFLSCAH